MNRTFNTAVGVLAAAVAVVGCNRAGAGDQDVATTPPAATPAPAASAYGNTGTNTVAQAQPGVPGAVTLEVGNAAPVGAYIADANGRALWMLEKDKPNESACTGPCLNAWAPVLVTGQPTIGMGEGASSAGQNMSGAGTPTGANAKSNETAKTGAASQQSAGTAGAQGMDQLDQSKLSTLQRADGTTQVTYNGHPLYFHASANQNASAGTPSGTATSATANSAGAGPSGGVAAAPTKSEIHDQFGTWYLVTPKGTKDTGKHTARS